MQTDCQVCDSVTLSFLTQGIPILRQSFIEQSVVFAFALAGDEGTFALALLPSTFPDEKNVTFFFKVHV